jgi:putative flippase GtrA
MKFTDKHKSSSELSKIAIKKIYESLKKRKMYSLFKRTYRPLRPLKQEEIDRITFDKRNSIYLCNGEKVYQYKPNKKYKYNNLNFFNLYKTAKYILADSRTIGTPLELAPSALVSYVAEDYFTEKNKKKKPHITDVKFTIFFGLIFTVLGVFMETLACYFVMPEFLPLLFIFISLANLLGITFAFFLKEQ